MAALNGPQDIVEANRALYKARRDVLVECFGRAGWEIPPPPASMFAWAPIPEAYRAMGSMEFAKRLLAEAGVAVSPGVGFGEEGEGYVRIALVENEHRIRQAARGVKAFLAKGREYDHSTARPDQPGCDRGQLAPSGSPPRPRHNRGWAWSSANCVGR